MSSPAPNSFHQSNPFCRVVPIPNCGNGVVAEQNISAGTVIIVERAVLAPAATALLDLTSYLKEHKSVCDALCPHFDNEEDDDDNTEQIKEKILSNTFSSHGGTKVALYSEISMINHSCDPNSAMVVVVVTVAGDADTAAAAIVVIRDVVKGTELTIDYACRVAPKELRRRWLQQTHHFECHCVRCNDSAESHNLESFLYAEKDSDGITNEHPLHRRAAKLFTYYYGEEHEDPNAVASRVALQEMMSLYNVLTQVFSVTHWKVHAVRSVIIILLQMAADDEKTETSGEEEICRRHFLLEHLDTVSKYYCTSPLHPEIANVQLQLLFEGGEEVEIPAAVRLLRAVQHTITTAAF
eukprot:PhM_4_TR16035/c0_g1_i1/m.102922